MKNNKETEKIYRARILKVRREFYKKVGEECLFCGSTHRLSCHRISFEKHTKIARLTINQVAKEKIKDYVRLCIPCHLGVHWTHKTLGLDWEDIISELE